jgi:hypothetical protein
LSGKINGVQMIASTFKQAEKSGAFEEPDVKLANCSVESRN